MPNVIETLDAAGNTTTGYTLGVGQTARGTIGSIGDQDYYRVNLVAGQTYSFAMVGTGPTGLGDSLLTLFDSTGTTVLASNDDGLPNRNSVFTFTATTTGSYYLDAADFSTGTGQYGVSVTAGTRPSFDNEMGAGVIDTRATWSAARGTGVVVTYGFRDTPATYTASGSNIASFTRVSTPEQAAVQAALQYYSELCGITFQQVNPGGYTDSASILIGNYTDATDGAGAFAYYPGSTASTSAAGDVWLNTGSVSTTSLPLGSYSFLAIMHELGHTLGLSHPGLYNAAPGVSITYANNAQFAQDSNMYSIMSYFSATNTGGPTARADTPMLFDVLDLQQIYGANMTTRTGNTVYGFGSTAGSVYDFATNLSPVFTIWDAGGTDTLNASGYSQNQTINLNAGTFSSIGGLTNNISIAVGAVIENAVGGSGNDTLIGNAANNSLSGGAGTDVADYSYATSNIVATLTNGNGTAIGGADVGTDTLTSIEALIGGSGNDNLYAYAGTASLYGGGGNDVLVFNGTSGAYGDGGAGNDYVYGGTSVGTGTFHGGSGAVDVLVASSVVSSVDYLYGDGGGYDYFFAGAGTTVFYGNATSTSDVEVMNGSTGFSTMYGGIGTNYFYAGTGAATMQGGSGINIYVLGAEAQGDIVYGGSGVNYVYGGRFGDTMYGGAATDVFAAGSGADTIEGGAGVNYAWGGAGHDTFVLDSTKDDYLVVQDWGIGGTSDTARFINSGLTSFADVVAHEFYVAGTNTTIITPTAGHAIWLVGVAPGQLNASQFTFS